MATDDEHKWLHHLWGQTVTQKKESLSEAYMLAQMQYVEARQGYEIFRYMFHIIMLAVYL